MLTEELYYKTEKTSSKKEKKGNLHVLCAVTSIFGGTCCDKRYVPTGKQIITNKKKEKGEWGDTDTKSWLIPNNT